MIFLNKVIDLRLLLVAPFSIYSTSCRSLLGLERTWQGWIQLVHQIIDHFWKWNTGDEQRDCDYALDMSLGPTTCAILYGLLPILIGTTTQICNPADNFETDLLAPSFQRDPIDIKSYQIRSFPSYLRLGIPPPSDSLHVCPLFFGKLDGFASSGLKSDQLLWRPGLNCYI